MTLPPLYPILDAALLARRGFPLREAAEAILEGGAGILQLRVKGHFSRPLFHDARRIAALCASAGVPFLIDDRADIALLLDAGLHIGQDDLPPADARSIIGPGRILGFSTHNRRQLLDAAAEPVDYLAIGPVFATSSKENPDPVLGPETISRLRPLTRRPLVAIGGITRQRARQVLDAGADSLAVIGDLYPEPLSRTSLRTRIEEWQLLLNNPPRA